MPAPSYIAKSAFASGTAALSVGAVAGAQNGDLILLFIESENQAVPSTPTGGAGGTWAQVSGSPQGTGTAAAAGATRLTVYWQIATGADATTSVPDTGDHTCAIKVLIRGADTTNPFDATSGNVQASAATTLNMPTVTTSVANCLIVYGIALDIDGASTARIGTVTNANLSTITERHDETVAAADGGGIGVITGVKATAGAVGTTTVAVTSTIAAYLTMAIKEPPPRSGSMSTTETGSDTASGTGDVIVDGAMSVSETGADTLSANGTVADSAITGSMAVTESGSDTLSGTGDVIVRGSLSVSETGNDTASGTGDVIVRGSLSASEGGTDTFSGSGFGVVAGTGSMAATESGSDTLSATGDVIVRGSLAVSESGSDTLTASGDVIVRGSLSVSETGSDTFAGSGNLAAVAISGVMSATESADTTGSYADDGYIVDGYYQTGWAGKVIVSGAMSASEDPDRFSATNIAPVRAVRGHARFDDAQAEWEARKEFRKQAVQIIERLDEAPQEAPVTVEAVAEVAPRFSLVEAMSEGVELGLDIDPILLALQARNAMQAEQTAMVLLAAIEQEREAIALAWFMAEAA